MTNQTNDDDASNPWIVDHASENGQWIVVRVAKEVPETVDVNDYPEWACVHWTVQSHREDLMPNGKEMDLMDDFEDLINEHDCDLGWFMYSITGNLRKEWVWYVKNGEDFISAVEEAASQLGDLPIKVGFAKANNWEKYHSILAAMSTN
jgi:hypothetical protein